jgi:ankyrin repeat protein
MTTSPFTWQSDDLDHMASIDGDTIRYATVTDEYDDDVPYTAASEKEQPLADFLAGGPSEPVPTKVLAEMLASLGRTAPWLDPLRLQEAAASGDLDATKAVLDGGAQKNAVVRGKTALSVALANQHLPVAAFLVTRGAAPNVRLAGGETALHVAARNAGSSAWAETLRGLLAAKADLVAQDDAGQTPLLAGLRGHLSKEGVEVLVADSRAVNLPAHDGTTPLIAEAKGWCRPSVMRALLGAGADVNARAKDGWSALLYAITKNDLWLVKMLIERRADVNVVGQAHRQGYTPLSALAMAENLASPPPGGLPTGDASTPQVALKRKALELAGQIVVALKAAGAKR